MRRRLQTRGGTSVVSRDTHGTPGTLCPSVEVIGWDGAGYAVCGGVKGGVCMQCLEG